jgi:hypothetical protein
MFVDHMIKSKSLLRNQQNIWKKSYYELFICDVFVDNINNLQTFLRNDANIYILKWYELFICGVLVAHIMHSKIFLQANKICEWNFRTNYTFPMCFLIIYWTPNLSLKVMKRFEQVLNINYWFVVCSSMM